ncbi:poly-beta-1,6-N-acetyl-D-glucosamine synthase [Hahella sp. HN01]|uniref:poly-beta-1,6-N-acetyl-D-glucosamine synthase n=1 Tax=Hahella sp. HN01 TaxID=2847262 RepID=UPI001C1EF776|nr:poly-beta-1,6-N-acetyl-D-glucosamine synthase [Hahella sp. HN01]MBU6950164.1 poly-beta-1,6 N-acetyl-D-glucosamine synthase [Hahella sp. HN01]
MTLDILLLCIYLYPSVMALVWITGGVYYFFHWERRYLKNHPDHKLKLRHYPLVSVMVPCYNEGANIKETIDSLLEQDYPNYEIIAINDGSKDDTGARLDEIAKEHPRLRVIHQENQGKAAALNNALEHAQGDCLVCIDGDALLDPNALVWMVRHFLSENGVGAVTGNPRVRTRSTIIGKIQTGEFSSIIGLIKRAQRIYGTLFTISGVVCAFRKSAVQEIGGWNTSMVTEDIDVSWRLQMAGWNIRYEPMARCWVLMPETIRGLYKQRLRWAQGGAEVCLKYGWRCLFQGKLRFWPLLLEYLASVYWSYSVIGLLAWRLLTFSEVPTAEQVLTFEVCAVLMIFLCLLQFLVSILIDRHYDQGLLKNFLWCIWYPLFYWILNIATVTIAVPKALFRKRNQHAVWESPDRGEIFRG